MGEIVIGPIECTGWGDFLCNPVRAFALTPGTISMSDSINFVRCIQCCSHFCTRSFRSFTASKKLLLHLSQLVDSLLIFVTSVLGSFTFVKDVGHLPPVKCLCMKCTNTWLDIKHRRIYQGGQRGHRVNRVWSIKKKIILPPGKRFYSYLQYPFTKCPRSFLFCCFSSPDKIIGYVWLFIFLSVIYWTLLTLPLEKLGSVVS